MGGWEIPTALAVSNSLSPRFNSYRQQKKFVARCRLPLSQGKGPPLFGTICKKGMDEIYGFIWLTLQRLNVVISRP